MRYDFSGLSADHLAALEKKLTSMKKSFFGDYNLIFDAITNEDFQKCRGELTTIMDDKYNDQINKSLAGFSKTMLEVNETIKQYIPS